MKKKKYTDFATDLLVPVPLLRPLMIEYAKKLHINITAFSDYELSILSSHVGEALKVNPNLVIEQANRHIVKYRQN